MLSCGKLGAFLCYQLTHWIQAQHPNRLAPWSKGTTVHLGLKRISGGQLLVQLPAGLFWDWKISSSRLAPSSSRKWVNLVRAWFSNLLRTISCCTFKPFTWKISELLHIEKRSHWVGSWEHQQLILVFPLASSLLPQMAFTYTQASWHCANVAYSLRRADTFPDRRKQPSRLGKAIARIIMSPKVQSTDLRFTTEPTNQNYR